MEYQPFVSLVPWTIIIQAANLLILTAILGKLLFRPVQKILQQRRYEVENIYSEAGKQMDEAREMRSIYTGKLKYAASEAAEIKRQAEAEIEKMRTSALERAKGEAAHIRESAKRQIELERKKAADQLRTEASRLAVATAEKLIQREINENDRQKLLEEFIESAESGI